MLFDRKLVENFVDRSYSSLKTIEPPIQGNSNRGLLPSYFSVYSAFRVRVVFAALQTELKRNKSEMLFARAAGVIVSEAGRKWTSQAAWQTFLRPRARFKSFRASKAGEKARSESGERVSAV